MSSNENKPENQPKHSIEPANSPDPYVVGIGAAAGGLQALDELFKNIPRDSVAYVILQHLSPEHKTLLKELLSKHTPLRFRDVAHDMPLEVNNVYLIPAGKQITLKGNHLQVTDRVPENATARTIDTFFKSLAREKGSKAIGIILSGTGVDGAEGIKALKKAKGLVLVQDPETARFDGMPRHAINSGFADYILPPQEMPDEIFNFVKITPLTNHLSTLVNENDPAFLQILELVRERSGIDFRNYKRPTIIRRISRRMAACNTSSLLEYLDYLQLHTDEADLLGKEFLIGVTNFFRDPEAFEVIEKEVIPALADQKTLADQLRIWVVGCSSGEEAYSLAILVREHLDEIGKELEVKIFASDIDRDALDYASKALYTKESLADVPADRKKKYFVKEEGKYRIVQRVRRMVIFAPHNIINDAPFSNIDLITCRNMLIYLSPMLQKKVINKFHYALRVSGYLFLGSSESIGDGKNFLEVNKKWKIFQTTTQSRALGVENFGATNVRTFKSELKAVEPTKEPIPRQQLQHQLSEILNESILDEYGYAAVYVDENYDLVHGFGEYTRYLTLPNRTFTLNIFKLVPADLALNLGTMLRRVNQEKERLTARGVLIRENDQQRHINITIRPYFNASKSPQKLFLILFSEDNSLELPQTDTQTFWNATHYETRVSELEGELQLTKEDLQNVVEALETANEELQSTNEELLSSNEELQSTNEELQSLNEELHTVNAEHQYKIKMLIELDDDLNNYFRSTDIGQVFLDLDLRIRKFTPAATHQINLIESDIGRSITQISINLKYDNFIEDIKEAIQYKKPIEREIQSKSGVWHQTRILPYLTQDKRVDGAIIIFINIHELKSLHLLQDKILDSSPSTIMALSAVRNNLNIIVDFECTLLNKAGEELLGKPEKTLLTNPLSKAYPALLQQGLLEQFIRVVDEGEMLNKEIYQLDEQHNAGNWIHLTALKLEDGLVLTLRDITKRKAYEQKLLQQQDEIRASGEQFRTMLEAFPHITWTGLPDGRVKTYNKQWYEYTGFPESSGPDLTWEQAVHPDDLEPGFKAFTEATQNKTNCSFEVRIRRYDGVYRWHLVRMVPYQTENQETMWIGTSTDVHDQKVAERENTRLRVQQQREVLTAILHTQEAERKRISEALHNGLGQILYATKLNFTDLADNVPADKKTLKVRVNTLLDEAITATRNISFELTPSVLKDFGLKTAIKELITRIANPQIKVTSDIDGFEERLPYLVEISLYRIVQELLNNILKHSKATEAVIELVQQQDKIYLSIQDNGVGFEKNKFDDSKGLGLSSIKNRVNVLGGQLRVDSRPGQGTVYEITAKIRN
ncbi:CheR family methyltransferase [Adhaeribacter aquaticus]|uniref:CheR family methyltransferase n=1 Tax=Adhaeribacter aquaticus TaxID=299567 RepID=UPI0004125C69|nr:CheR family methyltransferase [Adhaeribacter aquaticus]